MTLMTVKQLLRKRVEARILTSSIGDKTQTLQELREEIHNPEWDRRCEEGLLMGRFRYGRLKRNRKNAYDSVGSAIKRLKLYQKTGNAEYLVDAANLCKVEFVIPNHPDFHWESVDDGLHAEKIDATTDMP